MILCGWNEVRGRRADGLEEKGRQMVQMTTVA